jgi:hypothetical protein
MNFGERPKPTGFTGTHSLTPHFRTDQTQITALVLCDNYAPPIIIAIKEKILLGSRQRNKAFALSFTHPHTVLLI